jgi:polysaccharide deacetylase family protein (PEP-CTERM system associated)
VHPRRDRLQEFALHGKLSVVVERSPRLYRIHEAHGRREHADRRRLTMGAVTAMIGNAMSIDVEDYFHVTALSSVVSRSQWGRMEYRADANTDRLLEIFAAAGVKSTFFILGWVARRSPGLVRRIQAAGHEIASHGMSHQLIYTQTLEEFTRETRESKALLEDITCERVHGYRAATYSITRRSLWALDVLHEAGFTYDSSIFPIKHDLYGIPDAPQVPTRISAPRGGTLVEFPMSTVSMFGVRLPVSGGGYFRLLPYPLLRAGLRKINERLGRPFVFYLHPWEIDPGQPRIKAGLRSRLRHYTNIGGCEQRLRQLLSEFRFTTVMDVLASTGLLQGGHAQQSLAPPAAFVHLR